MSQNCTRALTRPQHLFDIPAITVWSLAALGEGAIRLAHALDRAMTRSAERRSRVADLAGDRHLNTAERHFVPDSWKVR